MLRISVAIILAASGVHGQGSYVVGPNVHVSLSQPTLQHFETQIAADPHQAGHLIKKEITIMLEDRIGEATEDSAIDPPESGGGGGNAATGASMALEPPAGEEEALSDPPESGGGGGGGGTGV